MMRTIGVARCVVVALVLAGALALPIAAQASFRWAAPVAVDPPTGAPLRALVCRSSSQCVALDQYGRVVTFNPTSPGTPTPAVLGSGSPFNGLACPPLSSECVAVDGAGREVTFNPDSPGGATPVTVDAAQPLFAVACPTATECNAVGPNGIAVTFNPDSPSTTAVPGPIGTSQTLFGVACPSSTICVAVGAGGTEVTFTPELPATAHSIDSAGLRSVACRSSSLCVAVDEAGQEVKFDPGSPSGGPTAQAPAPIDGASSVLLSVACPLDTQCTAVDNGGQQVTFNPTTPGSPTPTTIESAQTLWAVACPTTRQCTLVSGDGAATTFDPTNPGNPSPSTIDMSSMLNGVACPASSQCTAVDAAGRLVTFNQAAPGSSSPTVLDTLMVNAVACPTSSQCSAVGAGGTEFTLNPASPGSPTPTSIGDTNVAIYGLACPATFQCTAVDELGQAITFDPTDPSTPPSPLAVTLDSGHEFYGVACLSNGDCVAVGDDGVEVKFPAGVPSNGLTPVQIDAGHVLTGVACPSDAQCVAVDNTGQLVTFDPASGSHTLQTIDSGQVLNGITCPAVNDCLAFDRAGQIVEGDPTSAAAWAIEPIAGAGSIGAVSCVSVTNCVAVDAAGRESGGTLAPPVNIGAPTITGSPTVGQTLIEAHGTWTNAPTSFSYQWEDCDSSGNACQPIVGATLQMYTVANTDVGHTIAVTEKAFNAGGSGGPVPSLSTAIARVPTAPPTPRAPAVVPGPNTPGSSTVALTGSVVPNGLATTYHFEYGLDPQYFGGGPVTYGQSTAETAIGSDFGAHDASVTVSGLVPNALYHVRLVATNVDGTTTGPDETFTTLARPAPLPPVIAQSVNVAPVTGVVLIKPPPGTQLHVGPRAQITMGKGFVPLTQALQIPAGSQIDARRGTLTLTSATGVRKKVQKGTFFGALFTVTQTGKGHDKGLTILSLLENAFPGAPSFASCQAKSSGASAAKLSSKTLQLLHGHDNKGKFGTKGRYAAATVRGTTWEMSDQCDGTLTKVQAGVVSVKDFRTGKTITVHAGHSYLAKARPAKRR